MKLAHSIAYRRLARRLREARTEVGLTQDDVAKLFQVPQSWVSKCESGERRIDAIEIDRFAALYGKPLSYFLQGEEAD